MPYQYPFEGTDENTKKTVFEMGTPIEGYDASIWRHDICGYPMKYSDHGDTNSKYGWEIDHKKPEAKGGKTEWDNLQPLYWKTNRTKGDTYPWNCSML